MNKEQFVAELAKLRPASTFLNLHHYRNEHGEDADYNVVFHVSYENALKRSVALLESFVPATDLETEAKHAVLLSYHNSIASIQATPIEEIDDAYVRFFDANGIYIKGCKMHRETGHIHLYGFIHQKVVHVPGTYKKVNSAPLTIEKNKLRRLCPVSKFRQFRMLPNQVDAIRVQKMTLLPPTN